MSVEVIADNERPCPCGNGTFSVSVSANDWGGTSERWLMRCADCRAEYALLEYSLREKDRQWLAYVWVLKSDRDRLNDLGLKVSDGEKRALLVAQSEYMEDWMALVTSAPTKRQLWVVLTDDGTRAYPSISTFYSQVRRIGMARFWKGEFSYRNLDRVLTAVGADGHQLRSEMARFEALRDQRSQLERQLIESGVA